MKHSETHRNRQVHRYLRAWQQVQTLLHDDHHAAESKISRHNSIQGTSTDKALKAFAQLAALRLNATRVLISLIDADTQYILTEATQTISLMDDKRHGSGDQLTMLSSVLPRKDGLCQATLLSSTSLVSETGSPISVEAFVVLDTLEDDRFKDLKFVQQYNVRSFVSVPIVSDTGANIGAYSIISEQPRDALTIPEYEFIRDVSSTVFEHLLLVKNRLTSVRGSRMIEALTSFATRGDFSSSANDLTSGSSLALGNSNAHDFQADEYEDDDQPMTLNTKQITAKKSQQGAPTVEEGMKSMYLHAADHIRRATDADGCVFLEVPVSHTNTASSSNRPFSSKEEDGDAQTPKSEHPHGSTATSAEENYTDSDASHVSDQTDSHKRLSDVLGYSLRPSADISSYHFPCTQHSLRQCILRYPNGKVFHFTDIGTISSGDDTTSDESALPPDQSVPAQDSTDLSQNRRKNKGRVKRSLAEKLFEMIPEVKSVIFLPLWDFTRDQWQAGLFLWTKESGKIMDAQDDLPYLRAFGNTIMNESSRLSAVFAEQAKTTFIASVSHELRSPLHGILGSVEFMADTKMDSFQRGLVGSVETCGKTLLDTIDHVLDYAKINHFGTVRSGKGTATHTNRPRAQADMISHTNHATQFNICTLVEEVVDAIYAGRTFAISKNNTQVNMFVHDDDFEDSRADKSQSSIASDVISESENFPTRIALILDVRTDSDYIVIGQPGALRRIVMNLVGNALKYTDRGKIRVSLRQNHSQLPTSKEIAVELFFDDTGRGISSEYLRDKLYRPFSQENPFSTGTGLGLSIVHQIISSLNGRIQIQSEKNRGTHVQVSLKLPIVPNSFGSGREVIQAAASLAKDKKICILEPDLDSHEQVQIRKELVCTLRDILIDWLGMQVLRAKTIEEAEADFYLYPEPPSLAPLLEKHRRSADDKSPRPQLVPLIIMCTNAMEEAALKAAGIDSLVSLGLTIEIISQPCGPIKLARALKSCMQSLTTEAGSGTDPLSTGTFTSKQDQTQTNKTSAVSDVQSDPPHPASSKTEKSKGQDTPHAVDLPIHTEEVKQSEHHVLIVDDNAVNLNLLVAFMKKLSLPYGSAVNGLEAFELYCKQAQAGQPFTFVLMDISMPVMDGLTSTREIRQFEQQQAIQPAVIVALTGLVGKSIQEDALNEGCDRYFSKPVRFKDLQTLLARSSSV